MAGKKEVQKTVAFRLNLSRADDRELYQAIMKHGRNVENDIYGSSGAYVKAAVRHYHRQESELERQEQNRQEMQDYMRELAEEQGEVFLERLAEHDKRLAAMVVEAVLSVFGKIKISDIDTNEGKGIGDAEKQLKISPAESMTVETTKAGQRETVEENEAEDSLLEEAILYLSNL